MLFRVRIYEGAELVGTTTINSQYDDIEGVPVTNRVLAEMYVDEYLIPRGLEDKYHYIIE